MTKLIYHWAHAPLSDDWTDVTGALAATRLITGQPDGSGPSLPIACIDAESAALQSKLRWDATKPWSASFWMLASNKTPAAGPSAGANSGPGSVAAFNGEFGIIGTSDSTWLEASYYFPGSSGPGVAEAQFGPLSIDGTPLGTVTPGWTTIQQDIQQAMAEAASLQSTLEQLQSELAT